MSGIGFWEFFFLCMIGLVVLGPKRLPEVASQLGSWVGQARRMTRVMRRQLEEELDFENELNIKPSIKPAAHPPPRDDDSYSPLHKQPDATPAAVSVASAGSVDDEGNADTSTDDTEMHEDDDTTPVEILSEPRRDA